MCVCVHVYIYICGVFQSLMEGEGIKKNTETWVMLSIFRKDHRMMNNTWPLDNLILDIPFHNGSRTFCAFCSCLQMTSK